MRGMPGYGDEVTWGPYLGHPNDPRYEEEDEEEEYEEEDEEDESEDDEE